MPAANTYVIGLAWLAEQKQFADECLVVPSEDVVAVAADGGEHWVMNFRPHSKERGRLDPYRYPLSDLATLVTNRLT